MGFGAKRAQWVAARGETWEFQEQYAQARARVMGFGQKANRKCGKYAHARREVPIRHFITREVTRYEVLG